MTGDILGEIRIEEREDAVALIVRRASGFRPWDVWTIVEIDPDNRHRERESGSDPTFGHRAFTPIKAMQQFYIEDITYYAARWGSRRSEGAARKLAKRKLDKFLAWRAERRELAKRLEAADGG